MAEEEKKWHISDIGTVLRNSLSAIMRGELLLTLNVGKYFVHILYTFFIFVLVIWISLMIDSTMAKVERGKKTIAQLEMTKSEKTFELVSLTRRASCSKALANMGSGVGESTKPATTLQKR